jgi:tetratricopeptide (TPR) repeat protein
MTSETAFGVDHPSVAIGLNNLAQLYLAQGKYAEAEPLQLRDLAISEASLGKDHPDVAISLNNLARLYEVQGNYTAAEPLYLRSLAICKNVFDAEHPETKKIKTNYEQLLAKMP